MDSLTRSTIGCGRTRVAHRPQRAQAFYERYVELKYLKRYVVLPIFVAVFILLLYLLGRFLAYGVGRMVYNAMEATITQLPIIRAVYTSVKQVTDFIFSEREMEFTRVVAIEYPRRGIWSLGFVTGEGMRSIASAAARTDSHRACPHVPHAGDRVHDCSAQE